MAGRRGTSVDVSRRRQSLSGKCCSAKGWSKRAKISVRRANCPRIRKLLDYLAVSFSSGRDGGAEIRNPQSGAWDVKALLKLIVMSATYRQSSKLSPQCNSVIPTTECSRAGRVSDCRRR